MPPNNKKQRGRAEKQKRNDAQQAAQKKAEAQQAQQKTAEQELTIKRAEVEETFRRTQQEVELQRQLGTPAIDTLIKDMAHSASNAAAAAAQVSKASASSSTTSPPDGVMVCYHGSSSSARQFDADSEYLKLVKSYVVLNKKYAGGDCDPDQHTDAHNKFFLDTENQKIMNNVECTNFVFALGVSLYLKLTSEEKESYLRLQTSKISTWGERKKTASYELAKILQLGLVIKYDVLPRMIGEKLDRKQLRKYLRDSATERGVINCLYRETKNHCGCMVTDKDRANDMDKMDFCHRCRKGCPKAETKVCDGCNAVVYCTEECQSKDWPRHREFCKREQNVKRKNNDKTKKKKKTAATTGTTATSTATESISTPGAVGARTNKSQSSPTAIKDPPTTEVPTKPVASVMSQRARRDTVSTTAEELRLLNTPANPTRAIPTGAKSSSPAAVGIVPTPQTQKPATTPKSISKPVLGPLGGNKPVATTAPLPPSPIVMKVDSGDEGVKPNNEMAVDDCDTNETTK